MQSSVIQLAFLLFIIATFPDSNVATLNNLFPSLKTQWTHFWDPPVTTSKTADQPMWLVVHSPTGLKHHIDFKSTHQSLIQIPAHNLKQDNPLADHSTQFQAPLPPPPPPPKQVAGSLTTGVLIPPHKTSSSSGQYDQALISYLLRAKNITSDQMTNSQSNIKIPTSSGQWGSFQSSNSQFGQSAGNFIPNVRIPTSNAQIDQSSSLSGGQYGQSMSNLHHHIRIPNSPGQLTSDQSSALLNGQFDQSKINSSFASDHSVSNDQTKISTSSLWSYLTGSHSDQSKVNLHHQTKIPVTSNQQTALSTGQFGQSIASSELRNPIVPYPILISPANYWGSLPVIPLQQVSVSQQNIKSSLVADSVHHSFPTKEGFGGLPGQIHAHLTLNYVPPATPIESTNSTDNTSAIPTTSKTIFSTTTTPIVTKPQTEKTTSITTTENTTTENLLHVSENSNPNKRHVPVTWVRIPREDKIRGQ